MDFQNIIKLLKMSEQYLSYKCFKCVPSYQEKLYTCIAKDPLTTFTLCNYTKSDALY